MCIRDRTQYEWVLLIALLQFRNRRLVVAEVERDITAEVRIETHLVGIVALVQYRFGCGQVLLRFFASSWLSDTDTRQRALPSELPQVLLGRAHVGLAQRSEVPALVPLKSVVRVTRFEINPGEFIRCARRIRKLFSGVLRIERLPLVLCRLVRVALEGVGYRHRPQRLNFRSRWSLLDGLCQMLARLLVLALQIQSHSRGQVCLEEIWGELQRTIVKGESLILLALAIQLLALFDKFERIVGFSARLTRLRLCAEKDARKQECRHGVCLLYTSPSPRDRTRSRMPS